MELVVTEKKHTGSWSKEELFTDGDAFFEDVIHSIDAARHCVDFETYIFNRDAIGERVLDSLIQAAGRGVKVRLLLDGVGSFDWTPNEVAEVRLKGIDVRIFHPLPWYQTASLYKFVKSWEKMKRRDHRKCIIIDQKIAYVGSANVTGSHCKSVAGKEAFRDTCVKLEGKSIGILQREFNWTWESAPPMVVATPPCLSKGSNGVRANSSKLSRQWLFKDLFLRITRAQRRVWIMTPYFVPRLSLLYAFRAATRRGVDVRILLPRKSDVGPLRRLAHNFYSILLKHKVRIFEYCPTTLHGKICLIDDLLIIGSSNLNYRSLIYDYELDVVLTKTETIEQIEQHFKEDFKNSEEIQAAKWQARSIGDRVMEKLVLPFKNWS